MSWVMKQMEMHKTPLPNLELLRIDAPDVSFAFEECLKMSWCTVSIPGGSVFGDGIAVYALLFVTRPYIIRHSLCYFCLAAGRRVCRNNRGELDDDEGWRAERNKTRLWNGGPLHSHFIYVAQERHVFTLISVSL
jgi:hypothetical protein